MHVPRGWFLGRHRCTHPDPICGPASRADPQMPALGLPSFTGLQLLGSPPAALQTGQRAVPVLLDSLLPTLQHRGPRGPSPRPQARTPESQCLGGVGSAPDLRTPERKGEPRCSEAHSPGSVCSGQPKGGCAVSCYASRLNCAGTGLIAGMQRIEGQGSPQASATPFQMLPENNACVCSAHPSAYTTQTQTHT